MKNAQTLCQVEGYIPLRLNIYEINQAVQLVLDWHCYF